MSGAYGPVICCRCDKPIVGEAVKIEAFSASGARPDSYRHPSCEPPRPPASRLPQYI